MTVKIVSSGWTVQPFCSAASRKFAIALSCCSIGVKTIE
jgi:hypothetical protein